MLICLPFIEKLSNTNNISTAINSCQMAKEIFNKIWEEDNPILRNSCVNIYFDGNKNTSYNVSSIDDKRHLIGNFSSNKIRKLIIRNIHNTKFDTEYFYNHLIDFVSYMHKKYPNKCITICYIFSNNGDVLLLCKDLNFDVKCRLTYDLRSEEFNIYDAKQNYGFHKIWR